MKRIMKVVVLSAVACLLMSNKAKAQTLWSCPSIGPVSIANPSNWSLSAQVSTSAYFWSDANNTFGIWSSSGGSGYSYSDSASVTLKFTNNTSNLVVETAYCDFKAMSGANYAPTDAFSVSDSNVNSVNSHSNAHGNPSAGIYSQDPKSTSFLVSAGPGQLFTMSGSLATECFW